MMAQATPDELEYLIARVRDQLGLSMLQDPTNANDSMMSKGGRYFDESVDEFNLSS